MNIRMFRVRTPEGIEFSQPIASPVLRLLAVSIDFGIILLCVELIQIPLTLLRVLSADTAQAIAFLAAFGIQIGYGITLEWRRKGQTIGKRVMQIRVAHSAGSKLLLSQIVMRNLLRVVDQLPLFYAVGGLTALADRQGRRLGDLAAGTVVVRIPKPRFPPPKVDATEKYNSLRDCQTLTARLRREVTPELADAAWQAVRRRASLSPEARWQLFSELAARFQSLVPIPEEAVRGLSEERLVLDIVDVLFCGEKKS